MILYVFINYIIGCAREGIISLIVHSALNNCHTTFYTSVNNSTGSEGTHRY